jgi:hypothetical protein
MTLSYQPIFLVLALTLLSACGKDGNSSPDGGSGGGIGGGGDIGNDPRDVTGSFFFESEETPAVGVELVLSNWTDLSMRTYPVKSDGGIVLALTEFQEGQIYSLHLINEDQKVADLDLSINAGLQSAFVYRGGYGFDLGQIIIPKDGRGIILVPDSGLEANIGGGFSIDDSSELSLEGFPEPSFTTETDVKPSMIVSDAADLYYGILNPLDSLEIERVRSRYSALSFRVNAKSEDSVVRSFISRISDWYKGAKIIPDEFASDSSTAFWLNTDYALTQDGTIFSADVVTGEEVVNKLIYLKVEGKDPPQSERLRVVSSSYSTPPYLEGVSLIGGVPSAVNYGLPSLTNGLTTPFCHASGDVVLDVLPPKDMNNEPVLGDVLDIIEMRIDYYHQQGGVATLLDPASALIAPFDQDIDAAVVGNYTESWQATSKMKVFAMSAASALLTKHRLILESALFPTTLGGKTVSRIKVKMLFKNKNHPGKSGSVIWIRKDC